MLKSTLLCTAFTALHLSAFAQFVVFGSIEQRNVTTSSFDIAWTTNSSGVSAIRYGLTSALEMGMVSGSGNTTQHQLALTGLSAATFYYARPCLITANDTVQGALGYYSTASTSSGQIRIFFNKSINSTLSQNGASPEISNNSTAIENELIEYINNAQTTIDVCVYNVNRSGIVTALKNAHNRGVRVRYIASVTTANTALSPAPAFDVAYVNQTGLMHNKFMVVDAETAADAVVWTGSMNWTDGNIFDDYNNVVVIHDQSLARSYTKEFEEMWGGNTATFNSAAAKVGSQKTDNTPHRFYINGIWVESYFSPSDNATTNMKKAMQSAASNVEFLILSFTNNELGTGLINEYNTGTSIYGVIANEGDLGCELPTLQTAGLNVVEDANLTGELHHKYAIVDANYPFNDPMVITGSHNWSDGAEDVNDENTLIIHDADITNMYLQEFGKRWCDVNGAANCALVLPTPVGVEMVENTDKIGLSVYPNPSYNEVLVSIEMKKAEDLSLQLYTANGALLENQQISGFQGTHNQYLSLANLSSGMYFLILRSETQTIYQKIIKY